MRPLIGWCRPRSHFKFPSSQAREIRNKSGRGVDSAGQWIENDLAGTPDRLFISVSCGIAHQSWSHRASIDYAWLTIDSMIAHAESVAPDLVEQSGGEHFTFSRAHV